MCHKLASGLMALLMVSASMFAVSKAHAAQKLALFPFELVDVAQDPGAMGYGVGFGGLPKGPDSDEVRRLKLITDDLSRRITSDGRYEIIAGAAFLKAVSEKGPIHKCNGCEDDIAKAAGAELALIAIVEKLSDLLFNFNLYLRDVKDAKLKAIMSTTIQGSTDEAWLRGIRYLAERKLLVKPGDAK
ncbi:MAG: DUF3280 domain-containing protein [Hyphomicrobiaceae bacterium]|nr:DUF3280 domain-containing protein [Hyphomicrobiaceae bacterium]